MNHKTKRRCTCLVIMLAVLLVCTSCTTKFEKREGAHKNSTDEPSPVNNTKTPSISLDITCFIPTTEPVLSLTPALTDSMVPSLTSTMTPTPSAFMTQTPMVTLELSPTENPTPTVTMTPEPVPTATPIPTNTLTPAPTPEMRVEDMTEEQIIQDFLTAIYQQDCLGFDYWEYKQSGRTRIETYYDYDRRVVVIRKKDRPKGNKTTYARYEYKVLSDDFVPQYYATVDEIADFKSTNIYKDFYERKQDKSRYELLVPKEYRYKDGPGYLVAITPTPTPTSVPTPTPPNTTDSFVLKYFNVDKGDKVVFGKYKKEDIEWLVLTREGNRVLLLSKYGLSAQRFNGQYAESNTWENCDLRKWLNEDFWTNGFTKEEQKYILPTIVSPDKNPMYSTNTGNSTTDKVFLLSVEEVLQYFPDNERERICLPTENAKYNEYVESYSDEKEGCVWWLRSPGEDSDSVAVVYYFGKIDYDGYSPYFDGIAVRPAIWISIEP